MLSFEKRNMKRCYGINLFFFCKSCNIYRILCSNCCQNTVSAAMAFDLPGLKISMYNILKTTSSFDFRWYFRFFRLLLTMYMFYLLTCLSLLWYFEGWFFFRSTFSRRIYPSRVCTNKKSFDDFKSLKQKMSITWWKKKELYSDGNWMCLEMTELCFHSGDNFHFSLWIHRGAVGQLLTILLFELWPLGERRANRNR